MFLVGPYGVGKDWVAGKLRLPNYKFAAPLKDLFRVLTGGEPDKTEPGVRASLQRLGAWGRGDVSSAHPLTAERAVAVSVIRTLPGYETFGHPRFWIGKLAAALPKSGAYAVTDTRFPNELELGASLGTVAFVTCGWGTVQARRTAAKLEKAPADASEAVSVALGRALFSGNAEGIRSTFGRFHVDAVVWNDTWSPKERRQKWVENAALAGLKLYRMPQ